MSEKKPRERGRATGRSPSPARDSSKKATTAAAEGSGGQQDRSLSPTPYPRFQGRRSASSQAAPLRKEWTSSLYRGGDGTHSGIPVSRREVEAAFRFFDVGNKGVLTPKDLRDRLGVFYEKLTPQEYRFLIPEKDFTVDKLYALLANNDLTNFDPVREAYKLFDPEDKGFVDEAMLRKFMGALNFGELNDEDIEALIKVADTDGDGVISMDDFRHMLDSQREEELKSEWTAADAIAMAEEKERQRAGLSSSKSGAGSRGHTSGGPSSASAGAGSGSGGAAGGASGSGVVGDSEEGGGSDDDL